MSFTFVSSLPSPDVIREQFPLAANLAQQKQQKDEETEKKVFTGGKVTSLS